MAKSVTNEAVLTALRGLGLNITGPVSTTGAQNSEWKRKVMPLLIQQYGQEAESVFSRAIDTAKKIKDIPADVKGTARLAATLRAYGTDEKTMVEITNEARRVQKTTPGYREGNKEFGDNDFAQAAANVLGHTGAVLDAFSNAGIKQPPPPAPGSAGEKAAPVQAVPAPGGPEFAPNTPGIAPYIYRGDIKLPPGQQPKPTSKPPGPGGGGGPTTDASGRVVDKALGKNASDADIEAYFRRNYGAEAWMLNIPDFKDIIRQVATNPSGWSVSSVVSAVQAKPWWQQNGQSVADYLKDKANLSGPDFEQKLGGHVASIKGELNKYGIALSDERITQIATEAYKWGWKPEQINKAVADEFDYVEGQHTVFVDKLKTEAKDFLVPMSEGTIDLWGKKLIADPTQEGNWKEFLKEQAKGMFPAFASRLDTGETMSMISKPYAAAAANLLEMDEKDIDFTDPKWMTALDTVDDKGVHKSMAPADWIKKIKTDSVYRYDYTEQAKESAVGLATDLMKKFGVTA
jgi:hypothetical protein